MNLKISLVILLVLMFLTANTVSGVFHKSILTEETKFTHRSENLQKIKPPDKYSTLNQKEPKNAEFSNTKTKENPTKSQSTNIFPFYSFVKDVSTRETDTWHDFAKVDGDSAELVIGVNTSQPDSYVEISSLIVESGGELVDIVSIEGEIVAMVADLPLDLVFSFVGDVQKNNLAKYIEPNMKYQVQLVPNDTYWNLQWGPQKIEADYAWNTTTGNPSILVAVIDTGIDYNHSDLAANYVPLGYDWVNYDPDPMDDNGHGTHCAGIIAAELNNGRGIVGLAQVQIMAEKAFDSGGWGYEDDIANAIFHAVNRGADILSNSWGGSYPSMLIYDAIQYAYNNDVLIVAAAGNWATSQRHYPAAYDEVIAVTATDRGDDPAQFTNFGEWVEVAAPGVDIYSTYWGNTYTYMSGTSMSTPHVAGVAALIWSQFPNMTRDWVRAQLRYTADDLGSLGFDDYYGYGRINARKAVEQVPPNHDLLIFNLENPRYIHPGDFVSSNVTVLNYGVNSENNITVHLLVDGNFTDSASISFLASGASTTVNVLWHPTVEGIYNVTYYIEPVSNETTVENNVVTEMIEAAYPLGYVLFDQTHWTDPIDYYSVWVANLTGRGYVVDTLTVGPITLPVLEKYDVFVVPQAQDYYSSDELLAIQNFVFNGGGFLVIGDDSPHIYTDLTNFAGITWDSEYYGWQGYTSDITLHDVTKGVITAYFDSPLSQLYVSSLALDLIRDDYGYGEIMLAASEIGAGRVIGIADEHSINDYYIGYGDNLQLANNMIDWLLRIQYEHELIVRLDAPSFLEPNYSSLLNATVYNRGLSNETDVELFLLINGTEVKNVTIPELVNGTSYTMDYEWTPTIEAAYNITAYAPPLTGENITKNNIATKLVVVTYPLIRPIEGQWANYTLNYYDNTGQIIATEYWNFTYDYYVEPYKINVTLKYVDRYGYIGTFWMIVNIMNRMVESGLWAGLWYPGWIETDITLGSIINLLNGTATVNGSKIILVDLYPIDCWELPFRMFGYSYTFWYDKTSGLWVGMEVIDPYSNQRSELLLVDTNVAIGTTYEHELTVALEAPYFLEPGNSSLLNATVYNLGTSNETNVELQLLINGTQVHSVTIPDLPNGTSRLTSYLWTPVTEAAYNVTAYVLPVPGENTTINNAVTRLVKVRPVKGYVLFDQTHWTDSVVYYSVWVANLADRGYVVDTLTVGPITLLVLEKYDVFVVPQAHDYYSSDELLAIQNFVFYGGGLLVIGDDAPDIYTDLTNFAGITWSWGGYWGYTSDITPHAVTEGVTTAYFDSPGLVRATSPAQDVIRDQYGNALLAVSETGLGAVVGIADEDSINDQYINYANNERLANNMIDWLKSRRPIASFTYSPLDPYVGETVTFDASASYDPDGAIKNYIWDFGDGSSDDGNITTHVYAAGGIYTIALIVVDNENLNSTFTTEITVSRTTLDIDVEVGSIHFGGEMAEFYILVSSLGSPVNANINATLYYNETLFENLTDDVRRITTGFYGIPYTIPPNASPGTYVLFVEANYLSLKGASVKSFLLSPTLTGWNAFLISINGTIGALQTDLGLIEVKLDTINATLTSVEGRIGIIETDIGTIETDIDVINATLASVEGKVATIESDLGTIKTDISSINGTLASIEGNVTVIKGTLVTLQTDIGSVQVNISSINARLTAVNGMLATIQTDIGAFTTNITEIQLEVTAINGTIATIQTTLGTLEGKIKSVEGDVATIETNIGEVKADISAIKEAQQTFATPLYVILIPVLILAAGAILLAVIIRRKS